MRSIGRILLTYGRNFLVSDIVGGGIFLVSWKTLIKGQYLMLLHLNEEYHRKFIKNLKIQVNVQSSQEILRHNFVRIHLER